MLELVSFFPQLDFTDFVLEESEGCRYDSLSVFGDFERREQIGKATLLKM